MGKIYIDLDETLIHAIVAGPRPPGKRRRFAFGLEAYDLALRPRAHYLLGCLQIRGFHEPDLATVDREIVEIVRKVRRFATVSEHAASKD